MARTIAGNLTGRAAQIDRADNWQYICDSYSESLEEAKLRLTDARDELKKLDPDGWEAWWDSPALPEWKNTPEGWNGAAQIIEERVAALKSKDPRTPEQIALDEWQRECVITQESVRPK